MTRYAAKGGDEHVDSITITPDQFATVLDGAIRAHMAVAKEATEEDIQATVFPHPTMSEAMHESALDAYGKVLHI